jgi:hypothetical protein
VTPVSRGGPEDEDTQSRFELAPLSIFGYANEFALVIAAPVLYRCRYVYVLHVRRCVQEGNNGHR